MQQVEWLADFELTDTGETRPHVEETPSKQSGVSATAHVWQVERTPDIHLVLGDVAWVNGERAVRVLERRDSPQVFDRLHGGLRLGVDEAAPQLLRADLMQARLATNDRALIRKASLEELDYGLGAATEQALLATGAREVGTRELLVGDTSNRRNVLCVTFPEEAKSVPVVAYVIARIAPVANRVPE